jgi:ABC-type sugar transport system substrate-binding protein
MLALAVLAAACGSTAAQDGGKIGWKGKGKGDDLKTIMADAKKAGKPMMLFFTSEG